MTVPPPPSGPSAKARPPQGTSLSEGGGRTAPRAGSQRWRPADRIRTTRDYKACLRARPRQTEHFLVYVRRAERQRSRLGLIVGRKTGNAVQRNRLRRRVRELFRTHRHLFPGPVDVIVRAKPGSGLLSTADCRREILEVLVPGGMPADGTDRQRARPIDR